MKQELVLKEKKKLPEGWKWKQLKDVVENWKDDIISGPFGSNLIVADYRDGGIPLIRLQNVQRQQFLKVDIKFVSPEKAKELNRHSYKPNDIVIAKLGIPIGKACIVPEDFEEGIVVADVVRVRINQKENSIRFVEYVLNSTLIEKQLSNKIIGSTRPRVNLNDVRNLWLPIPELNEQRKIVDKLDKQMAQIEMMKKEAEKETEYVNDLLSAHLKKIFESDAIKSYRKIKLKSLTTKVGSGITPRGGQSVYQEKGIPLIRSMNVHLNEFRKEGLAHISPEIDKTMSNTRVVEGDVLLNITGASIGRVCVVPNEICPANVNQHVSIIRPTVELNPYYLSYYISNPAFQKFIMDSESGATRQALTKSKIEKFEIPQPAIKIQEQLVERSNTKRKEAKELYNEIHKQLDAINELPSSILNEVFGEYEISSEA